MGMLHKGRPACPMAQLMLSTQDSDPESFRELYDISSTYLFSCALKIVHNHELAEEVLQESFVQIWLKAAHYDRDLAAPITWMAAIVRNKAIDVLRRERHFRFAAPPGPACAEEAPDCALTPPDAWEARQQVAALRTGMRALRGGERKAIELVYWQDCSHGEAAALLCEPLGTIKTWVRRGLSRMRSDLAASERRTGAPSICSG